MKSRFAVTALSIILIGLGVSTAAHAYPNDGATPSIIHVSGFESAYGTLTLTPLQQEDLTIQAEGDALRDAVAQCPNAKRVSEFVTTITPVRGCGNEVDVMVSADFSCQP